ncbi:MAG: LLM class flavin-dependent oxidoreductase [Acidimicrobiia bacterium]
MTNETAIGLVLGSAIGPEHLPSVAATAEDSGFDELWLAEDFFFTGGVSGAGVVLGATERVRVGMGVVSAVARHPALLAMEISTLARVFPGRLTAGIGLGVPDWVRQMGLFPESSLSALRECVTSVKRLLEGEEVSGDGRTFTFDKVKLTYPRLEPIPIHMGAIGPKMLRLSGEIADGSVLSVAASHGYLRWARRHIDEGRAAADRSDDHRITLFAIYSVHRDPAVARQSVRGPLAFYKAAGGPNALTDVYGISDELERLVQRGGYEAVRQEIPDQWLEDLTIAGTPGECAAKIKAFYEAGADSVALFPMPPEDVDRIVRLTAHQVLPRL